jgi:hypothetical protein
MENQQSSSPTQPPKDFLETYAGTLPEGPEKMYLLGRLKDQMDWYDNRSTQNKNTYRRRKIRIIVLSALIPVAVMYADEDTILIHLQSQLGFNITLGGIVKLAVALAGASVAIMEAISMFMKYRELWFNYRSASERLKQEAWKYMTKIGVYQDDASRFVNLVLNVEGIFEKESQQWDSLVKQESEKEKAQAIRDEVNKALEDMESRIKAKKEGGAAVTPPPATSPATTAAAGATTQTPPETAATGEQTATPPPAAETPPADTETQGEEEEESESHGEEEEDGPHNEEEETPKG